MKVYNLTIDLIVGWTYKDQFHFDQFLFHLSQLLFIIVAQDSLNQHTNIHKQTASVLTEKKHFLSSLRIEPFDSLHKITIQLH